MNKDSVKMLLYNSQRKYIHKTMYILNKGLVVKIRFNIVDIIPSAKNLVLMSLQN